VSNYQHKKINTNYLINYIIHYVPKVTDHQITNIILSYLIKQ